MMEKGLIHLYFGEGKGKTTAAMGLAVRAAGNGMKVLIVQFLKNHPTGELNSFGLLPEITVLRGKEGSGFSFSMSEEQRKKCQEIHLDNLNAAIRIAQSGGCDLLILDEAVGACHRGLLDEAALRDFAENKPEALELVMTGRNPAGWMLELADYASEIRKVKHPYEKGIQARIGIEK